MKLQSRVLIVLAIIWAITCLLIYVDSQLTLKYSYLKLEQKFAAEDAHRVQKALDNILSILNIYNTSYSEWDDPYEFMQKKNNGFIEKNYVPATFHSGKINFFLLYDTTGKLYYGKAFSLTTDQSIPIPANLLSLYSPSNNTTSSQDGNVRQLGFLKTPHGIIALSALPILTNKATGPSRGTMLMGYYFTNSHIKALSETVEFTISMIPLPLIKATPQIQSAYQHLTTQHPFYFEEKNHTIAYGYSLLKDIYQQPIALIRIEIPRTLSLEGASTMYRYLGMVIFLGIIILATLWYLLKIFVLDRIISVSRQVGAIYAEGKFHQRVIASGSDEINDMTLSINCMLELIELSQKQLKYRITVRTKELEKLSLLNRNLFGEIQQHESIQSKLKEDEKFLRKRAYYDILTELPNRAFFYELLSKELDRAKSNQTGVAILFLDADKFKMINDTYGHDIGDKFLQVVSQRLNAYLSNTDVVARLAGDEFILYLTDISDIKLVNRRVKDLLDSLTQVVKIDSVVIHPKFSIGISIYPDDAETIEKLVSYADLAMYYAKKNESGMYQFFSALKNSHAAFPLE
ncbi:MAG: hypothetical protein A3E85_00545 [Gammaproteobacteria bacterium RIFCSPHIGHO2_12_FULL_45_12]|nr:MAG: hypothetical protein A3E85_00545 [Gammaproteobacteria bacterium RIFCSPHIGHO2_12_FULL_45_12]